MERDIEFVFDALDGKTKPAETEDEQKKADLTNGAPKSKGHNINYRDEPVAFFFVLFGLAFEALVDQATSSTQRMEILHALKRILRPVISGNAIYQDAIFSETMDNLNRLVFTEDIPTQNVIVEIARNLSLDHPSAKGGQGLDDHLSDDVEQLFELTRSIILVLAGSMPNLREATPHARFNVISDDSLSLIRLSLSSLVHVASIFPAIIRDDLHACIFHIFSTILATGVCQAEVVPRALPIFKHFIYSITHPRETDPEQRDNLKVVSRQLRGCLTRFLATLKIAQRRESDSSLPCAKNTLLATTILLTTGGHVIPPQDPAIIEILDEFLDCLQDVGLANVAAGCLRSILLNNPRSPTDEIMARHLTPRLIAFLIGCPTSNGTVQDDPEDSKAVIARALVSLITNGTFTSTSPSHENQNQNQKPIILVLVVSALLTRAKREGKTIYQETATHLLDLAKADAVSFRALVASLQAEQKGLLEEILRSADVGAAAGSRGQQGDGVVEEGKQSMPSIALRMDF